ncbi:unnamed protein product [Fusarium fujikuroi]|uniref:Uncharacterized protein n=1 Tax=Fusarium fujikuroi TaxID=5127 RepID=A0A9Q9UEI9_FUSFU|nr:unnamed protein product [Fusarium fujikuroi]
MDNYPPDNDGWTREPGLMINYIKRRLIDDEYLNKFIAFALRYLEFVRLAAKAISLWVEPYWILPGDFEFLERMLKALYPYDPQVMLSNLDIFSRINCDFVMGL